MSTVARCLIALAVALLVGASHLLDGRDGATTDRLVAADKADAIDAAKRVARHPHHQE